MTSEFHDHFSARAADYAKYRPSHSLALVDYLASLAPTRELAWDAGCGSGQFSVLLAGRFERVIATDASAEQLRNAAVHPRVEYRRALAEASTLDSGSVDLAVAAQAAHWFDFERYYTEVRRVTKSGSILALVNYRLAFIEGELDRIVARFHEFLLAEKHWPPERVHVDSEYRTLPFPFDELAAPAFELTANWNCDEFEGYVWTWSAMRSLEKRGGLAMFDTFRAELERAWGDRATKRAVRWPVTLRVARL